MNPDIKEAASQWHDEMIKITQEMIRLPSPSGSEKDLAYYVKNKFIELGYDESFIDEAGNVIGIIKGRDSDYPVMFNSHLDQVDAGLLNEWEHPPFDGILEGGIIYGRGASDTKGAFAAQICAGRALKEILPDLKNDLIVSGVVYEEPAAMYGAVHLCNKTLKERNLMPSCIILGEATNLDIFIGHRGRVEIEITALGKTSHSSTPWAGNNAIYQMNRIMKSIQEMGDQLPENKLLGKSSIAVTNIYCEPGRNSIVPDKCVIYIDRRFIVEEPVEKVVAELQEIIDNAAANDSEFNANVKIRELNHVCYTGLTEKAPLLKKPFLLDKNNEWVKKTVAALKSVGQNPGFGVWSFGTDASYMSGELGIPTIGYSPAEEKYTHTVEDQVSVDKMLAALEGYIAIGVKLSLVKNFIKLFFRLLLLIFGGFNKY